MSTTPTSPDTYCVWVFITEEDSVEGIQKVRPHDGFIREEGNNEVGTSGVTWIIDPLDGTTNLAKGIPLSAISIGARIDDQPTIGIVYDFIHDQMFVGVRGKGAFCNGVRLTVNNSQTTMHGAFLHSMGAYSDRARSIRGALFNDALQNNAELRVLGSSALGICYVASGRFHGSMEIEVGEWDFAAGQVIAEEAGCLMQSPNATPVEKSFVITAAPAFMPNLQKFISTTLQRTQGLELTIG